MSRHGRSTEHNNKEEEEEERDKTQTKQLFLAQNRIFLGFYSGLFFLYKYMAKFVYIIKIA